MDTLKKGPNPIQPKDGSCTQQEPFFSFPLVAVVVVVVNVFVDYRPYLVEGMAAGKVDLILHVTEERLYRSVVQAIALARHRLHNAND